MAITQSIFSVENWAAARAYVKDEPVASGVYYYYASYDHTSSATFEPTKWKGLDLSYRSTITPEFVWTSNYPLSSPNEPKTNILQFGDGYSQRTPGQINNNLLSLDLVFEGRGQAEFTAICHFLYVRKGTEAFYFTPPAPFKSKKLFICKRWTPSIDFYQNYSISAKFDEVPA